jgi:hypothetical protein
MEAHAVLGCLALHHLEHALQIRSAGHWCCTCAFCGFARLGPTGGGPRARGAQGAGTACAQVWARPLQLAAACPVCVCTRVPTGIACCVMALDGGICWWWTQACAQHVHLENGGASSCHGVAGGAAVVASGGQASASHPTVELHCRLGFWALGACM